MKKNECPSGAGSNEGTWPLRRYCNDARIAPPPIRACTRVRGPVSGTVLVAMRSAMSGSTFKLLQR